MAYIYSIQHAYYITYRKKSSYNLQSVLNIRGLQESFHWQVFCNVQNHLTRLFFSDISNKNLTIIA